MNSNRFEDSSVSPLAIEELEELVEGLEAEIRSHSILGHPFLVLFAQGTLSRENARRWVREQFFFSRQFPRCLAALYARIEDDRVAQPLPGFLSVEHWGSSKLGAHWRQFTAVLHAFDLDPDDLRRDGPDEHTRRYLDYRLSLCLTGTPSEALGVVAYAHEFVNQHIFALYLCGMERLGLESGALEYFRSHVHDEPEDYRLLRKMISTLVHSQREVTQMRTAALDVLHAREEFFSDMLRRTRDLGSVDMKMSSGGFHG